MQITPLTDSWTSFKFLIPEILHFVRFGFSPINGEKILNNSITF